MGRQEKGEGGSRPGGTFNPDGFVVQFEDPPGNGQPEPGISRFAGSGFLPLVKTVKNQRQVFHGNAAPGIADTNSYI